MIAAFFRLVLIIFIVYLLFLVFRIFRALNRPRRASRVPQPTQGTMVKDEVCNTYLPLEEALREYRDGREHFFCSEECRREFLKAEAGGARASNKENG